MISFIKNNFFKIVKFGITGCLGTITNLIIFYITNSILKINHIICSIISFSFAVTQNYFINSFWTFRAKNINEDEKFFDSKISFKKYIKFVCVSLAGLIVNLLILFLMVDIFKFNYKIIAQTFGILGGMIFNYLGSHFFVYKIKK